VVRRVRLPGEGARPGSACGGWWGLDEEQL
jgi:hypothetical protein